jgi:imidazoleglycerol-phosphate dehydratase
MSRSAAVARKTAETDIRIRLDLDGRGEHAIATGIPFLDHMLAQVARHGHFDLAVEATGDLGVDFHHTVEDLGIALGDAVSQALGDKAGIVRYGAARVPMDESLASAVVDLSGRPYLVFQAPQITGERIGDFDATSWEFFGTHESPAGERTCRWNTARIRITRSRPHSRPWGALARPRLDARARVISTKDTR